MALTLLSFQPKMKKEPTVFDYACSLLKRNERIDLDSYFERDQGTAFKHIKPTIEDTSKRAQKGQHPFRLIFGLILAIIAQLQMEPPWNKVVPAAVLYLISALLIIAEIYRHESTLQFKNYNKVIRENNLKIKKPHLIVSIFLLTAAFFLFSGNEFTLLNVSLWISGCALFVYSVWQPEEIKRHQLSPGLTFVGVAFFVSAVSLFFRFYRLETVPSEMFSDHAEKLYDVMDVLAGRTPIFFIRNTGREPLQFYLTAAIIKIFNTGISFISLKLGTAAAGFITLIFIYLLGKELVNKWVGLGAAFFAGIAYWPNVISRVGLRFPFYPLFVALVLFYLFKGLKEERLNLLILSGIFMGIGLHGYSPIRVLPVLVTVVIILFALFHQNRETRSFAFDGFILVGISSFIIFLPLFRYLLENPQSFNYRMATRLTSLENPITEPILKIFLNNLWKSLTMFFYNNGTIWVNSIPNRPALDIFSAVLFFVGLLYIGLNIFKEKNCWRELSVLISIPLLMLPSILSFAFPAENPSLNRSGGAVVPVFLVCSYGFFSILKTITKNYLGWMGRIAIFLLLISIVIGAMIINFDLVFNQYADQYTRNAWNSSEIGAQIANFIKEGNAPQNAFVVPYPHWVDTRLVGIHAGFPGIDFALWADELEKTLAIPGDKIFIVKPEDLDTIDKIKFLYPDAQDEIFYSRTPGKDFIIINVKE